MSDPEPELLSITCPACSGEGMITPVLNNTPIEQGITVRVCPRCLGSRSIVVRSTESCWNLEVKGPEPGKQRAVLSVTWGGQIIHGEPLSQSELMHVIRSRDPSGGLVVAAIMLASENLRLRQRLADLEDKVDSVLRTRS